MPPQSFRGPAHLFLFGHQLVSRSLPAPIQLFAFVHDETAAVISITVL